MRSSPRKASLRARSSSAPSQGPVQANSASTRPSASSPGPVASACRRCRSLRRWPWCRRRRTLALGSLRTAISGSPGRGTCASSGLTRCDRSWSCVVALGESRGRLRGRRSVFGGAGVDLVNTRACTSRNTSHTCCILMSPAVSGATFFAISGGMPMIILRKILKWKNSGTMPLELCIASTSGSWKSGSSTALPDCPKQRYVMTSIVTH